MHVMRATTTQFITRLRLEYNVTARTNVNRYQLYTTQVKARYSYTPPVRETRSVKERKLASTQEN